MNVVNLIGRLTRDPELSYTSSTQTAVAHFTLAVDRPASKDREKQADFIRITVFGKQAECADRYLEKGRQVAVNGSIQTGSYKNKDGQTVYTTDVIANRVEFLGSKNDRRTEASEGAESYNKPDDSDLPDAFQATDDNMPF